MNPNQLLDSVREILWRDWDPIGVNRSELARDEYDSYAPKICHYLREGVDEYRLTAHLDRLERQSMGLSEPDHQRNRRVARKLLELAEIGRPTPPA